MLNIPNNPKPNKITIFLFIVLFGLGFIMINKSNQFLEIKIASNFKKVFFNESLNQHHFFCSSDKIILTETTEIEEELKENESKNLYYFISNTLFHISHITNQLEANFQSRITNLKVNKLNNNLYLVYCKLKLPQLT